jgi:hypothetical protein
MAMLGASAAANLKVAMALADNWELALKKISAKNGNTRRYMGKPGVRIPAVLLRVFEMGTGENVFSQAFSVFLLNTHGAESPESPALIPCQKPGTEQIRIGLSCPPSKKGVLPPAEIGLAPTECLLQSRSTRHFQTSEMDGLGKLKPGQIVLLNGVSGRAYVNKARTAWGIALDVAVVEPVHGLTLSSLYAAAQGAGTNYMIQSDFFYDATNEQAMRYNYEDTYFISVHAPPTTEAGREERALRMIAEQGTTDIDKTMWKPKTWELEAAQGRPRAIRADLALVHLQWLMPRDFADKSLHEVVLVGTTLWADKLGDFGIADIDTWTHLAPLIFGKLDFKIFGCSDVRGSATNFGGVASEKSIHHAVQVQASGIIADIEACYRKIGIPITAEYVHDIQRLPGCAPGGGTQTNDDDFLDTLPDVVPVSGPAASAAAARKLLDIATRGGQSTGDGKLEFVALLPYNQSPAVVKGIAALTPEEGSELVSALVASSDAEVRSNPKVLQLYEMMDSGKGRFVVAFAFCKGIVPVDVKADRNAKLISYFVGRAPPGSAAIEDSSSSSSAPAADADADASKSFVEEIADVAAADDVVDSQSEAEVEPGSRKRSVPKDKSSSKRDKKRARHD